MSLRIGGCGLGGGRSGGGGGGGRRPPPPSSLHPCADEEARAKLVRSIDAKRRAARKWTNRGLRPPPSLEAYAASHAAPPRALLPPAGEGSSSSASSSRPQHRCRGDEDEERQMRIALALSLEEAEARERREREDVEAAIAAVKLVERAEAVEAEAGGAEDAPMEESSDWTFSSSDEEMKESEVVMLDE